MRVNLCPTAIYVHIPFCRARCRYCDFNTYAGMEPLIPRYVQALVTEIALWGEVIASIGGEGQTQTLYLGGGTPSLLDSHQVVPLLEACHRQLSLAKEAEITMEANPGTVDRGYLGSLLEAGINRLSLGVQSFSDLHLKALGRIHSADEARQAYQAARQAGFTSINLDLLYGLPLQQMSEWRDTLQQAIKLGPDHLSLYSLSVEKGTPLAEDVSSGVVPAPDADLAADMYLQAEELLSLEGYIHYEISNWARPGKECRHNLVYWRCQTYLGIGAGAHSYWCSRRFHNTLAPFEYVKSLEPGLPNRDAACETPEARLNRMPAVEVESLEAIDSTLALKETMVLGLRLGEGLDLEETLKRFGGEAISRYKKDIQELVALELLEEKGTVLRLSQKGRLLGNEVFLRFFL